MNDRAGSRFAPNVDPSADGLHAVRETPQTGAATRRRVADTVVAHLDREAAASVLHGYPSARGVGMLRHITGEPGIWYLSGQGKATVDSQGNVTSAELAGRLVDLCPRLASQLLGRERTSFDAVGPRRSLGGRSPERSAYGETAQAFANVVTQ